MAGTGKKWLIGCGVGCGAAILLSILITVGGGILMTRPFSKAVDSQRELADEFGDRSDFTPPATGIAGDRLELFLQVRERLLVHCEAFAEIGASFRAMDEMDQGEGDPPVGQVLKGVGNVMGSVFGIAGRIGGLTRDRNEALLELGMGMGEYTWIYVMAYNTALGHEPNTGLEAEEGGEFSGQEREVIAALLTRHAEALTAAGRAEAAAAWAAEADRLDRTATGVPFAGKQPPVELVRDLAPYRARLEGSYCPAMAAFDLGIVTKKGFTFHSE